MSGSWLHRAREVPISPKRKLSQICDADYSTRKSSTLAPRLLTWSPKVYTFFSEHNSMAWMNMKSQITANSWDSVLLCPAYLPSHILLPDSCVNPEHKDSPHCRTRKKKGSQWSDLRFSLFLLLDWFLMYCFAVINNFHMRNISSPLSGWLSSNSLFQHNTVIAQFCVLVCWFSDILDALEGKDRLLAMCKSLVSLK